MSCVYPLIVSMLLNWYLFTTSPKTLLTGNVAELDETNKQVHMKYISGCIYSIMRQHMTFREWIHALYSNDCLCLKLKLSYLIRVRHSSSYYCGMCKHISSKIYMYPCIHACVQTSSLNVVQTVNNSNLVTIFNVTLTLTFIISTIMYLIVKCERDSRLLELQCIYGRNVTYWKVRSEG